MLRRAVLEPVAAGAAGLLALAGGGACRAGGDRLVRRPAQQLALTLADLPPGFRVGEELRPALDAASARADPWGRRSAYAVTFLAGGPGGPPAAGDVVSSVHAYADADQARAAFAAWQAAVPPGYQAVAARPLARAGVAAYVAQQPPAGLVGVQAHNVLASVWVGAAPGAAGAPLEGATRLAAVVVRRIEAAAGN